MMNFQDTCWNFKKQKSFHTKIYHMIKICKETVPRTFYELKKSYIQGPIILSSKFKLSLPLLRNERFVSKFLSKTLTVSLDSVRVFCCVLLFCYLDSDPVQGSLLCTYILLPRLRPRGGFSVVYLYSVPQTLTPWRATCTEMSGFYAGY